MTLYLTLASVVVVGVVNVNKHPFEKCILCRYGRPYIRCSIWRWDIDCETGLEYKGLYSKEVIIMSVRAKFKVESVKFVVGGGVVELKPVTCGSAENEKFYKYTPGGEMNLQVVSTEVANQFIPGKEYYIDITPAE